MAGLTFRILLLFQLDTGRNRDTFEARKRAAKVRTHRVPFSLLWPPVFRAKAADILESVLIMTIIEAFLFEFFSEDLDKLRVVLDL